MKFFLTLLGSGLAAWSVTAQSIAVALTSEQEQFLPYEELIVKVRITNYSGQTLNLGKEEDWLSFTVQGQNGAFVSRLGAVPVKGNYVLDSSRTGTIPVDLAPYFDLTRPGNYKINAILKIAQWDQVVSSEAKGIDIISGVKLWEQEFGMPQSSDSPPEIRKYALVQAIHLKQPKLYFRLCNASESRVFKVFAVGPVVSVSKPEPQLDRFSNLHLLYQVAARSFSYSVINPDGLIIARETHDSAGSRPQLRTAQEGRIQVTGGVRRVTASDLPPALSSTLPRDAKPPRP